MSTLDTLAYRFGQTTRSAWYFGHYLLAQRLYASRHPDASTVNITPLSELPSRDVVSDWRRQLYDQDLRNIEQGYYRMPRDVLPPLNEWLDGSKRFFQDLSGLHARRATREFRDVPLDNRDNFYPTYYLQNFHYQTDGWLSEDSAKAL